MYGDKKKNLQKSTSFNLFIVKQRISQSALYEHYHCLGKVWRLFHCSIVMQTHSYILVNREHLAQTSHKKENLSKMLRPDLSFYGLTYFINLTIMATRGLNILLCMTWPNINFWNLNVWIIYQSILNNSNIFMRQKLGLL